MDLDKAKAVSQRDKDLTVGYIREAQLLLPNHDNPYYNIPEIVAFITVLYFHMAEYFQVPGTLKISEDKLTVKYDSDTSGEGAAYGVARINPQDKVRKYKWKFRINIIDKAVFIEFGLVEADYKIDGSLIGENMFCAFESSSGHVAAHADGIGSVSFDDGDVVSVNDGDIVTLELNLEQKILNLSVNQKRHFGYIKTKLKDDKEYKVSVCLDEVSSVTIIDFDAS